MSELILSITKVEQLLRVAAAFGGSMGDGVHQLAELTSSAFESDGCAIIDSSGKFLAQSIGAERGNLLLERLGERIPALLADSKYSSGMTWVVDFLDGGHGIVVKSDFALMLIFRNSGACKFCQADADLAGALWRACSAFRRSHGASPSNNMPFKRIMLPPRVRQVLDCLIDGLSEKQIGAAMRISHHTVHVYTKDLYRRLGVNSRSELLACCIKQRQTLSINRRALQDLNRRDGIGVLKPGKATNPLISLR